MRTKGFVFAKKTKGFVNLVNINDSSCGDRTMWRKYALKAIIKLLFISLFHDKCLLFMLELY